MFEGVGVGIQKKIKIRLVKIRLARIMLNKIGKNNQRIS